MGRSLDDPVESLPQIGDKRRGLLNKLGIRTLRDLVEHYPRDYDDRSHILPLSELTPGRAATVRGEIAGKVEVMRFGATVITKALLTNETGRLPLVWYNQPYLKNQLKTGVEYIFSGMVSGYRGRPQMESPDYEPIGGELLSHNRIVPVYPVTAGLSQKIFRGLIHLALEETGGQLTEFYPPPLLEQYQLIGRAAAVRGIHFPENDDSFLQARKRLVFDELFLMQCALFALKGHTEAASPFPFTDLDLSAFLAALPFTLTDEQAKVVGEIIADFSSGRAASRLIQGDVGSGKTAVAMAAAYLAIRNGCQAVLMAPTEVLAVQHFQSLTVLFSRFGMTVELLTGKLSAREKREANERIRSGRAQMIVGTHALIQDKVQFANPALVITDEQHRFGVNQRLRLSEKGFRPHVLVMSATPIPRTLALILYGELSVSAIRQLPPGRQKIDTFCVHSGYRQRIHAFIGKEIAAGRQAYVICPSIDSAEGEDGSRTAQSVAAMTETLRAALPHRRVESLHGKMKAEAKQSVMDGFAAEEIQALVSTTVVEVGINVPNATVMVIEDADRFGLSQLHQLRGRVGRGAHKSYCILITDSQNKLTQERMQVLTKTNDGFEIAEMDLKLRGPGDFFGLKQHGLPEFAIANLYQDQDILSLAQEAAFQWLEGRLPASGDEKRTLQAAIGRQASRAGEETVQL